MLRLEHWTKGTAGCSGVNRGVQGESTRPTEANEQQARAAGGHRGRTADRGARPARDGVRPACAGATRRRRFADEEASDRDGAGVVHRRCRRMNKFFFANKIRLFANFRRFFAKWGLFFAKWGLLFASLYVRKSPAFLLNLGHPIAPLHFVCAI